MKAKDLPIYADPFASKDYRLQPREPLPFQLTVGKVRRAIQSAVAPIAPALNVTCDSVKGASTHVTTFQRRLADTPGHVGPLALVTIAGLTGIVAGHRRSAARRVLYASGLALLASAFCFPEHARSYAHDAYDEAKKQANVLVDALKK